MLLPSREVKSIATSGFWTGTMLPANTNDEQPQELMPTLALNSRWTCLLLLGGLLFMAPLRCEAQNLVPNPGFEETDSCTFGLGLGAVQDWFTTSGTPDLFQSCQPSGEPTGIPMNLLTYQYPFEGENYAGLLTYFVNGEAEQREWIMAPLLSPLVPGQTYYCSFRANAAFGGNAQYPYFWLASSRVGLLFTTYERHWYQGNPYPVAINQAQIQYPQVLTDTVGWTLVSGSFVADSAYTYVMVGNFFDNAHTDTVHFAPEGDPWVWHPWGYTLVDEVCVSLDPEGCALSQAVVGLEGTRPYVYPNPASDQFFIGHAAGHEAEVKDMLGRSLWKGKVQDDRFVLDVATWARGAYVLRVGGTGRYEVVKFVLVE
jgi:hypothetical protein